MSRILHRERKNVRGGLGRRQKGVCSQIPGGQDRNSRLKEALMSSPHQVRFTRVVPIIAAIVVSVMAATAQDNPYRVVEGWPQLPASLKWGAVISVDSDAKGNIWA